MATDMCFWYINVFNYFHTVLRETKPLAAIPCMILVTKGLEGNSFQLTVFTRQNEETEVLQYFRPMPVFFVI